MEMWFILALVSAVMGGLYIFTTKVAAERNYDIVLLSTMSVVLAAITFFFVTLAVSDFHGVNRFMLMAVLVNAITYMWVNVLRHNAMQCMDTAIYYPIYKTLTPALTVLVGIFWFAETFTAVESVGLILGLLVPLLLITRSENTRQKDLGRGLRLLLFAAVLAVIATAFVKIGTDHTDNTWLFITLIDSGLAVFGFMILFFQNNKQPLGARLAASRDKKFVALLLWMSVLQVISFSAFVFAIDAGPLGIIYTINSLYIIVPIVLSIIFYNEHWNVRKIVAIVLSVAALALLK